MDSTRMVRDAISESIRVKQEILVSEELIKTISEVVEKIVSSLKAGGKVILFGNGGSAADAQHIAAEFIGRFKKERTSLAAIALTTDSSIITAVSNDYGFDNIFSRQLEGLARPGDVAIGLSTSGNSENVYKGLEAAARLGVITIGMTGAGGGRIASQVSLLINVPSGDTPYVQESHIMIGHIVCDMVENFMVQ